MRTKADALERPMAWDRWRLPSKTEIILLQIKNGKVAWSIFPIGRYCYREPLARLVRLLTDAEYMGGANE